MLSRNPYRLPLITAVLFLAVRPASPSDIPIANSGFEQVVPACTPGPTCGAFLTIAGWTGAGQFWTLKPSTGPGGVFPGGIPGGANVAALGANVTDGSGVIAQTLDATLLPDTTYTLGFSVGSRGEYPFAGYRVELLAGSTTVAADSTLAPPSGTFVKGQIRYSSDSNPTLLGQRLGIRLTGNKGGQADFDNISLDATPNSISSSIAQIASGGGWKTTLILMNISATRHWVKVMLRGDDGTPMSLPLAITQQGAPEAATSSLVDRTLEPRTTLVIESEAPAASGTRVGWADVTSSAPLAGFAIFRQRGQDGRDSEGTAVLDNGGSSSLILPYDNTAGFAVGVALVNGSDSPVIVAATIRDDSGAELDLQAVALRPRGHTAFVLADRFPVTGGRRGIIEFQNTGGGVLTGLGLRFSPFGSFTSLPAAAQ